LFASNESGVKREMTGIARVCNSFCELEGTEAGATGADGAFDAAQHGMLQQCRALWQQDFAAGEVPGSATTGAAARINPSSTATAIRVSFRAMPSQTLAQRGWEANIYVDSAACRLASRNSLLRAKGGLEHLSRSGLHSVSAPN
jgi:hypothetical protein